MPDIRSSVVQGVALDDIAGRKNMSIQNQNIQPFALDDLPVDLGGLGMMVEAEPIIPGVYDAVLEQPETGVGTEAYIVPRRADGISGSAKKYGKEAPGYPELLVYSEDETGCCLGAVLNRFSVKKISSSSNRWQ